MLPLDGTFTPLPYGDYLWRTDDHAFTHRELTRHSRRDAERYDDFNAAMSRMAGFVKPLLGVLPPDPQRLGIRGALQLAGPGASLQTIPGERSIAFHPDDVDECGRLSRISGSRRTPLVATMAASGIIGTFLGVRLPGTVYVLLHHYMGEIDGVFRSWGLARVEPALFPTPSLPLRAKQARVSGPMLPWRASAHGMAPPTASSSTMATSSTPASSSPASIRTSRFSRLLEPSQLPDDFVDGSRNFRFRGAAAKVNLALDDLPRFTSRPDGTDHLRGAISISPSVDYMERAYDQAEYGEFSRRPYMDIVIPR